jgi:hypothetical protein
MLGAFALGALDSFERGIVEYHLRWCEQCREEAASLEQVANLIPLSLPDEYVPSPATKTALFDRIARADSESRPLTMPTATAPEPTGPVATTPAWVKYASTALIAPLALALLVMGVWANSMRMDLAERDTVAASQETISQSLPSGDQVQLYSVEKTCPTCQGNGQLGVSESNGMGMVVGWDFDPSQQHDVWQVNNLGQKAKVCQLHVDDTGAVMQMFNFPESPSVYSEVYITDEHGSLTYVSHLSQAESPGDTPPAST